MGQGGDSPAQIAVGTKPGKKKIIKRIVKKKVPKKKDGTENATEQNDELDKEGAGGKNVTSEVDGQQDGSSGIPPAIKTFVRKKIVKKPVSSALEKDETAQKPEGAGDEAKVKSEDSNVVVQEGGTKTIVKKKIVKRVPKRKAVSAENDCKVAEDNVKGVEKIIQPEDIKGEQNEEAVGNQMNKVISKGTHSPKMKLVKKEEKDADMKDLSEPAMETDSINQKVSQNDNCTKSNEREELKDKKEIKDHAENDSKSKTNKTTKEKKRSDEPPRHPGLFLQTKGSKVSKVG